MDVCEPKQVLHKQSTSAAARKPLISAENKNGFAHDSRTTEATSRHWSPTSSVGSSQKRYPSPNTSNMSFPSTTSTPCRAASVERKRTVRQSSSTPVQDATEGELFVRKQSSSKLPESLWPSTMRSLTVSFQSDAYTLPIGKKEKPISHASYDRMTRQPSNVTHKQAETTKKSTAERKMSPLKGKDFMDQLENSKPVDNLPPHLADQQLWRSRTSGKLLNALNGNFELIEKTSKIPSLSSSVVGSSSRRRFSLDGTTKPLFKSSRDSLMQLPTDDNPHPSKKLGSSMSSDRLRLGNAAARALYSHTSRTRSPSPSISRGDNPSQFWAAAPHKGSHTTRLRQPSPSRQFQLSNSVLSFIVDMKKGKKTANHIDDAHQLRMLYNRYLQWRYVNGQADAVLQSHKVKAEKMLCSVRWLIALLSDSILQKTMLLQQVHLKSKLYSILNNELTSLDEWASFEKDHISNLSCIIQDLQACTIRIPVMASARGEAKALLEALSSAVDIMQAIVTSLCPTQQRVTLCARIFAMCLASLVHPADSKQLKTLLIFHSMILAFKVEEMSCLLSELAVMAAHERTFLSDCESALCSIDTLQIEEYSLTTQLLQLKSIP